MNIIQDEDGELYFEVSESEKTPVGEESYIIQEAFVAKHSDDTEDKKDDEVEPGVVVLVLILLVLPMVVKLLVVVKNQRM